MDELISKDSLLHLSEAICEMSSDEIQEVVNNAVKSVQDNIDNKDINKFISFLYNILLCIELDNIVIGHINFSKYNTCLDKVAFIKGIELKNDIKLLLESTPSYENYALAGALSAKSQYPEIENIVLSQIQREEGSAESQIFLISVASSVFSSKGIKQILKERIIQLIEQPPTELIISCIGIMKLGIEFTLSLFEQLLSNCIKCGNPDLIVKLINVLDMPISPKYDQLLLLIDKSKGHMYEDGNIKNAIYKYYQFDGIESNDLHMFRIISNSNQSEEEIMNQAVQIIRDKNADLELLYLSLHIVKPNSNFVSILVSRNYPDFIRREATKKLLKVYDFENEFDITDFEAISSYITSTASDEFLEPSLEILIHMYAFFFEYEFEMPDCIPTLLESENKLIKSFGLYMKIYYFMSTHHEPDFNEFIRLFLELFSEETAKPLVGGLFLYVEFYPDAFYYLQPAISKALWIFSHRPRIFSIEFTQEVPHGMEKMKKTYPLLSRKIISESELKLYQSCYFLISKYVERLQPKSEEVFDRLLQGLVLNQDNPEFSSMAQNVFDDVMPKIYPELKEVPQSLIDFMNVKVAVVYFQNYNFLGNTNEGVRRTLGQFFARKFDESISTRIKNKDITSVFFKHAILLDPETVTARFDEWIQKIEEIDSESTLIPSLFTLRYLNKCDEEEIRTTLLDSTKRMVDGKSNQYIASIIDSIRIFFMSLTCELSPNTIQPWFDFVCEIVDAISYDDEDSFESIEIDAALLASHFLRMSEEVQTLSNLRNFFEIFHHYIFRSNMDILLPKYLLMENPEEIDLISILKGMCSDVYVDNLEQMLEIIILPLARYVAKNEFFIDDLMENNARGELESWFFSSIINVAMRLIDNEQSNN